MSFSIFSLSARLLYSPSPSRRRLCLGPSLDNPGGRINDDEWISDEDGRRGSAASAADGPGQLSAQLSDQNSIALHGLKHRADHVQSPNTHTHTTQDGPGNWQ